MRKLLFAIAALGLSACGPSSSELPAWQAALTNKPDVIRPYSPLGLSPLPESTATQEGGADAQRIKTAPASGAWAAMLLLGDDALAERPSAIRITAKVSAGALHFLTTCNPPSGEPARVTIAAGAEQTVYLPLAKCAQSQLIVANGQDGSPSEGVVTAIAMLAPPVKK